MSDRTQEKQSKTVLIDNVDGIDDILDNINSSQQPPRKRYSGNKIVLLLFFASIGLIATLILFFLK